jgi:hypothetical protein
MEQSKFKLTFSYEVLTTQDGSPSLRLWKDQQPPEAMHHLGGALSESIYIYGAAIEEALKRNSTGPLRVLSVGLGLGYNEFLTALYATLAGREFRILSFESEEALRTHFINWLQRTASDPEQGPFHSIYDSVLAHVARRFDFDPGKLKDLLAHAYVESAWNIEGDLTLHVGETQNSQTTWHCILYDAFSSGATPVLWQEEFLVKFLNRAAAADCVFTTYAATGALRRALTRVGFRAEKKPGFAGKRESTWAVRP